MLKPVAGTLKFGTLAFAILAPFVWALEGSSGAIGFALGFATAEISVLSFGALVFVFQLGPLPSPRRAVAMSTTLWVVKLPLMAFLTYEASIRRMPAVGCFLVGASLVYCVLIGLAYKDVKSSR